MKGKHRNESKGWLRTLATLMTLAMLAICMTLGAMAEDAEIIQTEVGLDGDEQVSMASADVEEPQNEVELELSEMEAPEDEPLEEPEEEIDVADGEIIIVGFQTQEKGEFKLSQKPTEEMVRENLPRTVSAFIADHEEPVDFNVDWQCDDYDEQSYGTFVFKARFLDETVAIDGTEVNTADIVFKKGVLLPQVRLTVVYVTGFEPLDDEGYTLKEKPETAEAAVEAMDLPDTVNGTLSDSEQIQSFAVNWVCENFDEARDGQYVFRAEFAGMPYALDASVEMPEVVAKSAVSGIITEFMPLERDRYVEITKPETPEKAIAQMGLPETVKAKVSGVDEPVDVRVAWELVGDYEDESGDFDFTAELDDGRYEDESEESLTVTLTVVISDDFTLAVNGDQTLTITGWKEPGERLEIPEEIEEIAVTALGDGAFEKCEGVKTVEIPDTVNSIGEKALDGVRDASNVRFFVYGSGTVLTSPKSYKTADGKSVELPVEITDIEVNDGGKLIVNTNFVIQSGGEYGVGHEIWVSDGSVEISEGGSIVNHGCIIIDSEDGSMVNHGTIYSCDVRAEDIEGDIEGNAVDKTHAIDSETGKCLHCNAELLIIGVMEDSKDLLNKIYDTTVLVNEDLDEDSFEVKNEGVDPADVAFYFEELQNSDAPDDESAEESPEPEGTPDADTGTEEDEEEEVPLLTYESADVGIHRLIPKALSLDGFELDEEPLYIGEKPVQVYHNDEYTFFVNEDSFVVFGEIKPYDISEAAAKANEDAGYSFEADLDETTYKDKDYDGKGKPKIKVLFSSPNLDDDVTLEEGETRDYTFTYKNKKEEGTATLKGVNNFTGTFEFKYDIDNDSSSGSSGSSSSSSDDDDDEDEEETEEEDDTGVLMIDDENYGRVLFGRDYLPRPFSQNEEEIGESTVDAFAQAESSLPKRLIIQPNPMQDAIGDTVYLDVEQTREKFETVHLRLTNEQIQNLKKQGFVELVYELEYARLRIPLSLLESALQLAGIQLMDGESEDPLTDIDMYDFCIEQVNSDQLSERETAALEGYEALFPMYRIDVNAVVGEYPVPAEQQVDADTDVTAEEAEDVEAEDAEPQQYDSLISPDQDYVMERLNLVSDISTCVADSGESVTLPEGCVSQVYFSLKPLGREIADLTDEQVLAAGTRDGGAVEIYSSIHEAADRDNYLNTFDGTLFSDYHARVGSCVIRLSCRFNDAQREILEKEIVQALTSSEPGEISSGFDETLPTLYPVLNLFNAQIVATMSEQTVPVNEDETWQERSAKLEILNQDSVELPANASVMFVSGDSNVQDGTGVAIEKINYVEGEYDDYAKVYPLASGLYGAVAPVIEEPEEDEEDWEDDEAEEDEEDEEEPSEPEPGVDPETVYAYVRSSNEGDMYWLVNTADNTVEFYREDTGAYMIGDYTGSLKNGMSIEYRENGSVASIRLTYPQTYRFATAISNDTELLMQQQDVASVESVMQDVR